MSSLARRKAVTLVPPPTYKGNKYTRVEGHVLDIRERARDLVLSFRMATRFANQARALLGHAYHLLGIATTVDNLADCKMVAEDARRALERGATASQYAAEHWQGHGANAANEIYERSRALVSDSYYGGMR